jgi:hypothetical protein
MYITKNTVVFRSRECGTIFLFSKDGTPKSRFNRKGQGPEEYSGIINTVIYDETTDDVFVYIGGREIIHVYSSTGKYKRVFALPQGTRLGMSGNNIVSFDDQSLFFFDFSKEFKRMATRDIKILSADDFVAPFYRICKNNGTVLDHFEIPLSSTFVGLSAVDNAFIPAVFNRTIQCIEGFRLGIPEIDTIFLYKSDGSLTPVKRQIPSVSPVKPQIFLDNYVGVGRYQYMEVATVNRNHQELFERGGGILSVISREHYVRDRQTGEMFQAKLLLP